MVFTEDFADEVEVRPGRRLFVRKVSIGSTKSTCSSSTPIAAKLQLICVHGTCATEKQYQLFLESLDRLLNESERKISCLLFDNVGCGRSPSLREWEAYGNTEIRADLEAVIRTHANPSLPTVLIGHSYAPSIFLPLLQENLKLIPNLSGCILMSTAVRSAKLPLRDGGHVIMRLPVAILRCIQGQLTEGFLQMAVHPDHVALKEAIRSDSNANDMRVAQAYHRHMEWAGEDHVKNSIAALGNVPTLILHGADDGVIPVECGQHLHNLLLPKSEFVVIDRASHLVMIEQPDRAAQEAFAFIGKLVPM